jgi:hypothetical protein
MVDLVSAIGVSGIQRSTIVCPEALLEDPAGIKGERKYWVGDVL